jgi:serpin B
MKQIILWITVGLFLSVSLQAQDKNLQKAVDGNNAFCFDWMRESHQKNENQIFSPQSISIAISMAYDGAKWRTKWEIANVMHFQSNDNRNHEAWTGYIDYFEQIKTPLFYSANAAWIQKDFHFLPEYIKSIEAYNAKIKAVDFKNTLSREDARKKMNVWVENQTRQKIKQLIRKGDVDDQTRLVLINAIYFDAKWQQAFPSRMTKKRPFNGNKSKLCEFMHNEGEYAWVQNGNYAAIELPYQSELSSMIVILPNANSDVSTLLEELDADAFSRMCESMKTEKLRIGIPKFKLSSRTQMKKQLMKMGMLRAFTQDANFKGMNGKRNLMIDEIIHQAIIDVNESGTEASAATAVVVREKQHEVVPEFIADRPFIFVIKENKLGSILFAGVLENPLILAQ